MNTNLSNTILYNETNRYCDIKRKKEDFGGIHITLEESYNIRT